ncbi:MAG: hypothetical protein CBC38_01085 [Gammaproteobacteria bacterium TMED78]|nr:MAG: hypothetical protein CBC38_01085 [Gammaproteobacteria bacterium TMED78]|tara:strand:- start:10176 stop:10505 length:330 start_codon:yes stop_codon:yes gene_type:complete
MADTEFKYSNKYRILIEEITRSYYKIFLFGAHKNSTHYVTVTNKDWAFLTQKKIPITTLLEFSFNFLLEREPNTSIMKEFEILTISKYYSNYEEHIKDYCLAFCENNIT